MSVGNAHPSAYSAYSDFVSQLEIKADNLIKFINIFIHELDNLKYQVANSNIQSFQVSPGTYIDNAKTDYEYLVANGFSYSPGDLKNIITDTFYSNYINPNT